MKEGARKAWKEEKKDVIEVYRGLDYSRLSPVILQTNKTAGCSKQHVIREETQLMLLLRFLSSKTQKLTSSEMPSSLRGPSESAVFKQEYPVRRW